MNATDFNRDLPIALGADHAGFECKQEVAGLLETLGWKATDLGTYGPDSVDYPDFAHPVSEMVERGLAAAGILFCGSGNGVCMTANKHQGVRAALCWTEELVRLARQHNNANILCVPARFVASDEVAKMVTVFLATPFEGGRHERRVEKIDI